MILETNQTNKNEIFLCRDSSFFRKVFNIKNHFLFKNMYLDEYKKAKEITINKKKNQRKTIFPTERLKEN